MDDNNKRPAWDSLLSNGDPTNINNPKEKPLTEPMAKSIFSENIVSDYNPLNRITVKEINSGIDLNKPACSGITETMGKNVNLKPDRVWELPG